MSGKREEHPVSRRGFLGQAGLCSAAALASGVGSFQRAAVGAVADLPMVRLGEYDVTRLIAGYNPVGGLSHATRNLSTHMRTYFTVEQTVAFLKHCEARGINTFQFDLSEKVKEVLDILWGEGSKLQFICLHAERRHDASLGDLMTYKPIAVVHHGGVTDALFRAGKARRVHDFVKKVHDRGVLAGVSSHKPENIARMADEGWENDLFMTSFHDTSRTPEEMERELGLITIGEPYLESDPEKMTAVVRQVDKPCLSFKILAAGRRCSSERSVGRAFEYAFKNVKKTDAVIVGMYPVFQDEVSQDAALTRKYGKV